MTQWYSLGKGGLSGTLLEREAIKKKEKDLPTHYHYPLGLWRL